MYISKCYSVTNIEYLPFATTWMDIEGVMLSEISQTENYSFVHMYHIFFIQSLIEGHFSCFHVLATMNNAAMNIGVHISLQINVFNFGGIDTPKRGCRAIWLFNF